MIMTKAANDIRGAIAMQENSLAASRKIDEATAAKRALVKDLVAQHRTIQAGIDTDRQKLGKQITELTSKLAGLRRGQQAVTDARAKLEVLPQVQEPEIAALDRDLQAMVGRIADCQQAIQQLEERQRAYEKAKRDQQTNAKVLLEQAAAQADVEVMKQLVAMLEALQSKMVEHAFESLLATANSMTHEIMPGELCYLEGEIGMMRSGRFISHKTFSGTEKCLAYAGISRRSRVTARSRL
jgi:chromosome segregation ATPase